MKIEAEIVVLSPIPFDLWMFNSFPEGNKEMNQNARAKSKRAQLECPSLSCILNLKLPRLFSPFSYPSPI